MGLLRRIFRFVIDITVLTAVILYLPGLPPYENLESFTIAPPLSLEGALDPKGFALNNVEKLFEGQLVGPECIEESPTEPNVFYSTLQGGAVVRFSDNGESMTPVVKFGKQCKYSNLYH